MMAFIGGRLQSALQDLEDNRQNVGAEMQKVLRGGVVTGVEQEETEE